MAVNDYALTYIAKVNLSSTTAVDFTSIPTSYESLMIVVVGLGNYGGTSTLDITCRVNGDTGSNYGQIVSFGDGSSYSYSAGANTTHTRAGNMPGNSNSGVRALNIIYIYDYGSTTRRRQIVGESYHAYGRSGYYNGVWNNTSSAINRVELRGENGTYEFASGTYAVIYGLAGF